MKTKTETFQNMSSPVGITKGCETCIYHVLPKIPKGEIQYFFGTCEHRNQAIANNTPREQCGTTYEHWKWNRK